MEYHDATMAEAPFPVEYAVLSLLLSGGKHGYQLRDELRSLIGGIWHIAPSRLYLALKRLESRGDIRCDTHPSPKGPPRKTYTLTSSGREEAFRWLLSPVVCPRDLRVEFLAKLCLLRRVAPEGLPQLITAQIAVMERLERELAERDPGCSDPFVARAVRSFRLGQVRAALGWLRELSRRVCEEVMR